MYKVEGDDPSSPTTTIMFFLSNATFGLRGLSSCNSIFCIPKDIISAHDVGDEDGIILDEGENVGVNDGIADNANDGGDVGMVLTDGEIEVETDNCLLDHIYIKSLIEG